MEEIKINVSNKVWIGGLLAMGVMYVGLIGTSYYVRGKNSTIDLIFVLIIMTAFTIIPQFIASRTRLVITDTSLTVKTKEEWIVQFDGVESFYVDKFNGKTFIGIRYKDNTEEAIADGEIAKERKSRLKSDLQGYPYEIYINWLSKTPNEICDLLNQRINSGKN